MFLGCKIPFGYFIKKINLSTSTNILICDFSLKWQVIVDFNLFICGRYEKCSQRKSNDMLEVESLFLLYWTQGGLHGMKNTKIEDD
jgi:hypothetical protein